MQKTYVLNYFVNFCEANLAQNAQFVKELLLIVDEIELNRVFVTVGAGKKNGSLGFYRV